MSGHGAAGQGLRVLSYSHDGFGIGHLRRSLRLASQLAQSLPAASVLAATGSRVAQYFEAPPGVDFLKLPSVTKLSNDEYAADGLRLAIHEVTALRAGVLEAAMRLYAPDVVLVDRYPLGMHGEMLQALETLRVRRPDAVVILGLRDILDDPATVRDEWLRKGHAQAISERYDRVLVYGDPRVYDATVEYGFPQELAGMVGFTGYLSEPGSGSDGMTVRPPRRERERLALCTVGGGKDGAEVAWAFLDAMAGLRGSGWQGLLVTGPFQAEAEVVRLRQAAAPGGVEVRTFIDDLPGRLSTADVVVSMAGYNTMCEVLAAAAPTVVVPRIWPRTEQLIRASRFAAVGVVEMIHPGRLSSHELRAAMLRRAGVPRPEIRSLIREHVDVGGLEAAARAVASSLPQRRALAS
jgi:predicted glycosyltransferase